MSQIENILGFRMNCVFCSKEMAQHFNGLNKIINVYFCLDCQQPSYETYYKAVCNIENGSIHSDQFVIDKYYVYRSYDVGKPRTAIYKNIAGILRDINTVSAVTLYPPVCLLPGAMSFDFSNIMELKSRLSILVLFS